MTAADTLLLLLLLLLVVLVVVVVVYRRQAVDNDARHVHRSSSTLDCCRPAPTTPSWTIPLADWENVVRDSTAKRCPRGWPRKPDFDVFRLAPLIHTRLTSTLRPLKTLLTSSASTGLQQLTIRHYNNTACIAGTLLLSRASAACPFLQNDFGFAVLSSVNWQRNLTIGHSSTLTRPT